MFFLGYMVHRLLLVALGRRSEDDRDHVANKRYDLAGSLLANLFRVLFRKQVKDMQKYIKYCVENGKEINWTTAIKPSMITRGLMYSLATGNWGMQGSINPVKTGVA